MPAVTVITRALQPLEVDVSETATVGDFKAKLNFKPPGTLASVIVNGVNLRDDVKLFSCLDESKPSVVVLFSKEHTRYKLRGSIPMAPAGGILAEDDMEEDGSEPSQANAPQLLNLPPELRQMVQQLARSIALPQGQAVNQAQQPSLPASLANLPRYPMPEAEATTAPAQAMQTQQTFDPQAIERITVMGFPRELAETALRENNFDVETAIQWIVDRGDDETMEEEDPYL
eukprot:CAMPEP_0177663190 /NCGR_PEP_ID=MMETSP0447-20121125/19775_1 /TAXON_ID=0 /ORGANISM="Stygamoeba regulata, Strain BSH-02190019" /LENGTH=229 /DNA_ID=CAMNT_0019168973 /DNA_START=26 /DNA_END=715 /DNA_ORIENTATION=+